MAATAEQGAGNPKRKNRSANADTSRGARRSRRRGAEDGAGKDKRESFGASLGVVIPYLLAAVAVIGYFVWIGIEMSPQSAAGGSTFVGIFGAILVAIFAAGLPLALRRGNERKPPEDSQG